MPRTASEQTPLCFVDEKPKILFGDNQTLKNNLVVANLLSWLLSNLFSRFLNVHERKDRVAANNCEVTITRLNICTRESHWDFIEDCYVCMEL